VSLAAAFIKKYPQLFEEKKMTPSTCLQNILRSQCLEQFDGRPLYSYRLSDNQYLELKQVLLTSRLNKDSLQNWDTCFVLFASEWWKRNYINDFSFAGICNELNLKIDQQTRSSIIESGIKRLRRRIYQYNDGARNFLGTIALEAGIPTKTLEQNGWLSKLMKKLYAEYVAISASSASFSDSFKLNAETLNIPQTFRQDVFSDLLERTIKELIRLKRKYSLEERSNPIEYLDATDLNWRNTFPIQVETKEGSNFLNNLLREIASIHEPTKYPISFDRFLDCQRNTWAIKAKLNLPAKSIFLADLQIISTDAVAKFENTAKVIVELVGRCGFKKNLGYATIGRRGEDRKLVIELPKPNDLEIPADSITGKFDLHLSSQGERLAVLPAGEELAGNAPWVFANVDGRYLLKAQSSFKSSATTLMVVVNKDFKIKSGEASYVDNYAGWARIFQVDSEAVFGRNDEERFRLTAKSGVDDKVKHEIYGLPIPEYINSNRTRVFVGHPKMFAVDQETLEKKPVTPEVKAQNDNALWSQLDAKALGYMNLRVRSSGGDTLFLSNVFILPQGFEVKLYGDSKLATNGRVELRNAKPFEIQVMSNEIKPIIDSTDDGYRITLTSIASTPPTNITLRLFRQGLGEIILDIPFPSSGVQILDKDGITIKRSGIVYLSQLHGIRIRLYNNSNLNERFIIQLRVIDNGIGSNESKDLYFKQVKENLGFVTEISLTGLREEMNKLFAVISQPDKAIALEVFDRQGILRGAIQIKQYSIDFDEKLITDDGYLELTPWDQSFDLNAFRAFRFDEQNQSLKPKRLEASDSTSVDKIRFSCASNFGSDGTWFVYPSHQSSLAFRPFTRIIGEVKNHEDEIFSLSEAAFIRDQTIRISRLRAYVKGLAGDYGHPDWMEIHWLWEHTNHLPMGFLDVWRAFEKNDLGICALYFQTDLRTGPLNRLMSEFPILVETIDFELWLRAAKAYLTYWTEKTDVNTAKLLTEKKINDLGDVLNRNNLCMFLKREILGITDGNFKIEAALLGSLIKFDYEQLTKSLNPDTCPQFLIKEINHAFQALPEWLRVLIPKVTFNNYIPVVYLPALLAYKSIYPDGAYPSELKPAQFYKIRKLIEVDEGWLHKTYDALQGFCLNMKR